MGANRRAEADRRPHPDRRRMVHAVRFRTSSPVIRFDDWLEDHCDGRWSMVLDACDEDLVWKTLRIMFEHERDKDAFKAVFVPEV